MVLTVLYFCARGCPLTPFVVAIFNVFVRRRPLASQGWLGAVSAARICGRIWNHTKRSPRRLRRARAPVARCLRGGTPPGLRRLLKETPRRRRGGGGELAGRRGSAQLVGQRKRLQPETETAGARGRHLLETRWDNDKAEECRGYGRGDIGLERRG